MRKFLCSILICLLTALACVGISGCKEKRNIKDFYNTYKQIAETSQNLALIEATDTYQLNTNSYKIDIDYTLSPKLQTLVEDSTSKYYYLKYFYQQLLDDSLAPLYFFGESISANKNISEKNTEKLFKNLDVLKTDYENIDYYLGILITSMSTNNDDVNLSYLKKLFSQYEQAITTASKLSATVCDVYFNTVWTNSNIDYSSKAYNELTDTDLNLIAMSTRARMYYYKTVYANIYNQLHIRGSELSDKLVLGTASIPEYTPYTFISTINDIESKSTESLRNNKQAIYNNIISLYNIQGNLELAYQHFNNSCSKITYLKLTESSSLDDINHGKIISSFANGIVVDSYEILSNLVELLYI